MQKILIIADLEGGKQHAISRGLALAALAGVRAQVVGFVHENLDGIPQPIGEAEREAIQARLIERQTEWLNGIVAEAAGGADCGVTVVWEKRIADWVRKAVAEEGYDLVVKTGHRSETWLHTPTDWQLIRGCPAPLLLVCGRRWRGGREVMAAVDLGSRLAAKRALNDQVVKAAADMARLLQRGLLLAYVPPVSDALRQLDMVDTRMALGNARAEARRYTERCAQQGIEVQAAHVKLGPPDKVLTSLAAKHKADLVVLGTVGRRALAGKLIGNTAERILRLVKADVLVIKP